MTPRPNGVPNSNKAISTTLSGGPDAEGLPLTIPSSHGPATLTAVTALAARATPHTIPGLVTTASAPWAAVTATPNRRAQRARATSMPVRDTTVDTHIESAISTTEAPE